MSDDRLTPAEHTVRLGDHLGRVAATYRFRSFGPLWNDPQNAALRAKRTNPHVLATGDPVHVPELIHQEVDRPTEVRHRFRAEVHPLELLITVRHHDGRPETAIPSHVLLDGRVVEATLSAGEVRLPVTPVSDRCVVRLGDSDLVFRLGFLQPADTTAGVRQRLNNLGYEAGDRDAAGDPQLRSALEEFQCDHGLVVDGIAGSDTRGRLVKEHGC